MEYTLLIILSSILLTTDSTPVHTRRHHHRLADTEEQTETQIPLELPTLQNIPKQYESIYVRFASAAPETPPWVTLDNFISDRAKRSLNISSNPHVRRSVCESVSQWVEKTEAEDMWGNRLRVLQQISVGNTRINQYFFETFCATEGCACEGIDTTRYTSNCGNKHIWAYAKTVDSIGNQGWNLIKLRGSCTCTITPKQNEFQSIWDDLR